VPLIVTITFFSYTKEIYAITGKCGIDVVWAEVRDLLRINFVAFFWKSNFARKQKSIQTGGIVSTIHINVCSNNFLKWLKYYVMYRNITSYYGISRILKAVSSEMAILT
jgi:hypothetical protein